MPHAKCDMAKMNTILDKVFKYGPSKIYGRWPLKILLGPFLNTLSRFKIFSLVSASAAFPLKQFSCNSVTKISSYILLSVPKQT